jgi:hypothetical protein
MSCLLDDVKKGVGNAHATAKEVKFGVMREIMS